MLDLQTKIYSYFQRNLELKVLFVFDNSLHHEYKNELDSATWEEGYQYVVFQDDWFVTKYKLMNEWQNCKTVLLFVGKHEPTTQEDLLNFPLLGAMKANMVYKVTPYDTFIQQFHLPVSMAMFVQKHIEELQRTKVMRWATPYMNPSLDVNTGMCILLSSFLEQEQLLSIDHILIRIMLLSVDSNTNKRDAFFRKLYHATNRDVLEFINQEFKQLSGQELLQNTINRVDHIVESLKYNAITQQITVVPSDPYGKYKIVNSLVLQRINSLITTALDSSRFHDGFLQLLNVVGGNVRESKLIELYGADAQFHYVSADLCLPIIESMAGQIKEHADSVRQRLIPILSQFKDHKQVAGIGKFVHEVANYYALSNAFRAISLHTPDMYIDTYINSVAPMDMAYRHAVGYFYTAKFENELPTYVENLKQHLDKDYADFTNELNIAWMDCVRQTSAGFGSISIIGRQAEFYQKMVKNCDTKQVVIVSDAFRYELAAELVNNLAAKKHIATLEAMLASMPTETKYTKLTLFPHAALKLDNLEMLVDGVARPSLDSRTQLLNQYKSNAVCVDYATIMQQNQQTNRELFKHPLVYIMHNTVDDAGHSNSAIEFTNACNKAIEELRTLILRLHDYYNVVNIIVTSDHGFLFQDLPIEDYSKHQIAEDTLERKTRYYLSASPAFAHGIAKFPLHAVSPMRSEQNIYVGVPCGTNRLAAPGGGYQFAHGGMALEEVIVPVVICRYQRKNDAKSKVGVSLVSPNLSVVSSNLKIALVQTEAVDTLHQERVITCALYDGENTVTPVIEITLNSTDEELTTSRMFNLTLTLNAVVQSNRLELRVYDKEDLLNPLIRQSVINNTLIERDEF